MSTTETASTYTESESSFSSLDAMAIKYHLPASDKDNVRICDVYHELIQYLSALLFRQPSEAEILVLQRAIQSWLSTHADGLNFQTRYTNMDDLTLEANYSQLPVALILLIHREELRADVAFGLALESANETLVCFYVLRNRVFQISLDAKAPGSYLANLQENLEEWGRTEVDDLSSFAMWLRANMAFFSQI